MNNPEHLIAVKASANRSKGARGPEQWLPENESYICQYISDWEAIKKRWELSMTESEEIMIQEIKSTCP
jgi:hypothetical protein